MANGLKLDFSGLMRNYRIYEIVDNTLCEYDLDKLYLDNEDNILGQFIDRFAEADDEISKRALIRILILSWTSFPVSISVSVAFLLVRRKFRSRR